MKHLQKLLPALICAGFASTSQAALFDRGNGMIYDADLNITWLANANQGAGSVYDDGTESTDGRMTWNSAMSWANDLVFGGFSDWRLPTTSIPCEEFGCDDSEMGHLFYAELGGIGTLPLSFANDPVAYGLFANIQPSYYWSQTTAAGTADSAWTFTFEDDDQSGRQLLRPSTPSEDNLGYAWAVRDGDVAAIPEPGTVALLGLGLAGLAARRRSPR